MARRGRLLFPPSHSPVGIGGPSPCLVSRQEVRFSATNQMLPRVNGKDENTRSPLSLRRLYLLDHKTLTWVRRRLCQLKFPPLAISTPSRGTRLCVFDERGLGPERSPTLPDLAKGVAC